MKFRQAVIFTGRRFRVPQGIQRIDTRSTHGWQVRCGGTKLFSDHSADGSGADDALARAIDELKLRLSSQPAPLSLQQGPSAHKTTDLPAGISGPVMRTRAKSRTQVAEFSLSLPRFGQAAFRRTVHIGNAASHTSQRYNEVLTRAVALREQAMADYQRAATLHRRSQAASLSTGRSAAEDRTRPDPAQLGETPPRALSTGTRPLCSAEPGNMACRQTTLMR